MRLLVSNAATSKLVVVNRPAAPRGIVVLMHGVNGHYLDSWGPVGEPGTFLKRLHRDLPTITISTYSYPSPLSTQAGAGPNTPTLETLTREWITTMRTQVAPHYDHIAVVAHCLGGLIARHGMPELASSPDGQVAATPRPKAWLMLTLDTPEDWSDSPLREPLNSIVATLGLTESSMRANATWWTERRTGAAAIDDHAVMSTERNWVTPFKPGSTTARATSVEVPHTELTRPPLEGDHAAYNCVVKDLDRHFNPAAHNG